MPCVFGAAADDDTGATDLAGMLAENGLRTLLLIDPPDEESFARWTADYDAVVIGTGIRALPVPEAYSRTREAVRLLRTLSPRAITVKYCSTFDSTPEGNIGPSLDAALDESGESFTVALPALPVNGRTTYMGHHFVHQQLLSDSSMRNHPLTPMTNPNLVSHLQSQTKRRVGLARYPVDATQLQRLRSEGVQIAILDCISDADLQRVCEAIADLGLISGSSAAAMKLPAIWQARGWWAPSQDVMRPPVSDGQGTLVAAGSCSVATRSQNQWLLADGATGLNIDALALARGESQESVIEHAAEALRAGKTCLIQTAASTADVDRVQQWAQAHGYSANSTGLTIASGLAEVVRAIVEQAKPAGLIVAGGETSSAVCRKLELGALEVGRNIEPGIPLCRSLGRFQLPVVLKSGNFGSPDFYGRARSACLHRP